MKETLLVCMGGALGAALRHWLVVAVHVVLGRGFPYGTLVVNVLGSVIIGVLYVALSERLPQAAALRSFASVGLIGALTTFSTFSLDTVLLLERGAVLQAMLYMVFSVSMCLAATYAALLVTRQLMA